MEIKGIERGKKEEEKYRRKCKRQNIYTELEITKVSDILQYYLRI